MYVTAAGVAAILLGVAIRLRRGGRGITLLAAVGAALAGFASTGWQADARLRDALAAGLEGRDFVVSGVVASLPQQGPSGLRFRFQLSGFPVERLRQRIRDAIYASVADRRAAGVLAALAVGGQSSIWREDWDLFRNTGVAHLVAISGLHTTVIAWFAGLGVGALRRRSSRAMLALPAPSAARWGGLLAAAAYALLAGWGVPSRRAVWMLTTVTVLRWRPQRSAHRRHRARAGGAARRRARRGAA